MKRMISGIKPTGRLTLGNYIGAIKPFVKLQSEYDLLAFIADLHSLTTEKDASELRRNTENISAVYLAAGLGPSKCVIFKQSDVPAHSQLEWVLTCNAGLPDLMKMPQYKNFLATYPSKATPAGMLMYPSLMAADILLYDADLVPCGADQASHVFLAKELAARFNKRYGDVFKLPEAFVPAVGAKIMSLSDPTKKMSKSESDTGTIYILDDVQITKKKVMRALTDSEDKVYYSPAKKPGVSNLMTIYSALTGLSYADLEAKYADAPNYGVFKRDLCEILERELLDLQAKVEGVKKSGRLAQILTEGAEKASAIANEKIESVYEAIGLH